MRTSLAALLAVSSLLVARSARAQQGYPAIVDSTLGVNVEAIEPQHGCQLCHTDSAGGTTSLRPFGQMMVGRYGLISTAVETQAADASLVSALQAMKADQPTLLQDLQKGVDPNPDVTSDPVPQYGCAVAPGRCGEPPYVVLVLALGSVRLLTARASKSRRAERRG